MQNNYYEFNQAKKSRKMLPNDALTEQVSNLYIYFVDETLNISFYL